MLPFMEIRLVIIKTVLQVRQMLMWMKLNAENLDERTSMLIGTYLVILFHYAKITLDIINGRPTPVRCMWT